MQKNALNKQKQSKNGQKRENWRLTLVKFFVAEHGLVISILPKLLAEV